MRPIRRTLRAGLVTAALMSTCLAAAPASQPAGDQGDLTRLKEQVRQLEEKTARLEEKAARLESEVARLRMTLDSLRRGRPVYPPIPRPSVPPGPPPRTNAVPPGIREHEFNGIRYYMMPLTGATADR